MHFAHLILVFLLTALVVRWAALADGLCSWSWGLGEHGALVELSELAS